MAKDLEFFKTLLNGLTTKIETNRSWNKLKDRPFYEDKVTGEVQTLDDKFIPDTIARSNDHIQYQQRKPPKFGKQTNNGTEIAYGIDKFVIIPGTNYGDAAYSYDGIEWFDISMPSPEYSLITYGDYMFVAYGFPNRMAYSYDGIHWDETTFVIDESENSIFRVDYITYGNGMFVGVGYNNSLLYSEDGINWTASTLPGEKVSWECVFYGNGKFIALPYHPACSYIAYSEDGINWSLANSPVSLRCYSGAYGDGKFVAFSMNNNYGIYSEDGISWTKIQVTGVSDDRGWSNVVYGDGKFIVIDNSTYYTTAAYSYDGVNWVTTTIPEMHSPDSVVYTGEIFVAVSTTWDPEVNVTFSHDGITWYSDVYSIKQGAETVPAVFRVNGVRADGYGNVRLDLEKSIPPTIARKSDVQEMINESLGVIENGTY